MVIDFHTHVGDFRNRLTDAAQPIRWDDLLGRLDAEGIDIAVLQPVFASPEGCSLGEVLGERLTIREQVLDAAAYSERIIPFGNLDPRWLDNSVKSDFTPILDWFVAHGCRGIGEITASLPADDPRVVNLFQQAGAYGLPVLLHVRDLVGWPDYGLLDEVGLPRLEELLKAASETIIVGHGPGFWAEIAADVPRETYPNGPVCEEGTIWRLMRQYPNLYADISAHSGFNGLTRDVDAGLRYLHEFQDRVVFGTDTCDGARVGWRPHLKYLKRLRDDTCIAEPIYDKITFRNAGWLLQIDV